MSHLPPSWCEVALGEIIQKIEAGLNVQCEERPPLADEKGLVKISAVTWGRFNQEASKTLPKGSQVNEGIKISKGDLLISRANTLELVGASVIVDAIDKSLYLSDKVLRLVVSEESKRWISYGLKTKHVRNLIQDASSGNQLSMRNISQKKLMEIEIPFPPISEQKRIADKLDTLLARIDAARERLDRIPQIIKRFRQSMLAAATSGELTEEWRNEMQFNEPGEVILGDVAISASYGSAEKSSKSGEIPVLRMGNIQKGKLDWEDLVFTSNVAEIEKYTLVAGDVLFNRTNSPELVGKTAVYNGERPAIFAGYLIRVRCSESVFPEYLNYCLNSPAGKDYCWHVKSDGVSQSNINAKKLLAFSFLLPNLEEQKEIIRRVEELSALADALETKYKTARAALNKLTPAILAKAFRGELVPQDPNDEPAEKLLQRIREARDNGEQKTTRRLKKGASA